MKDESHMRNIYDSGRHDPKERDITSPSGKFIFYACLLFGISGN